MKTSALSFLFLCFINGNLQGAPNPWILSDLSVNQIIELEDLQFDQDNFDLSDASMRSLDELKSFLLENKSVKIELRGHTNTIPSHEYCDELSTNRAQSVKDYLVESGISPDRLFAKGYGKKMPRTPGITDLERNSNQRVEVKVLAL